MLRVNNLSKSFGAQIVLSQVSFIVNAADRVGLVGPNGCGKSTLLKIIAGSEDADSGHVSYPRSLALGYLAQGLDPTFELMVSAYIRSGIPGWDAARQRVERLALELASMDTRDSERALRKYDDALAEFESHGGYAIEQRVSEILTGLGMDSIDSNTQLAQLSGGQRTRIGLARLLLAEPRLLLLDEPTNHLDIDALEWLERFLRSFEGAAIIVSHDRAFLDSSVSRILELDDKTHRITEYVGNYSDYAAAKAREREKQWGRWKDQQTEIKRLENAARHIRGLAKFKKGGKADSGDKFAKGFFANRGMETMRRAKQIEQRLEHLRTDERIDQPRQHWRMKVQFGKMPRSGQNVVAIEELGHAFSERWVFRRANMMLRHGERIALVGANGSGKTTLLRILAGEIEPAEGSVRLGANVQVGYMPQEQEILEASSTPLQIVQKHASMSETEARHFLHLFLFEGDQVFASVDNLSYGERARLLLARLVVAGDNCLLLDEPINHLDIPSRERFVEALEAFPGAILIATHDRAFIDRFAKGIWSLRAKTLRHYVDREEMVRVDSMIK